MYAVFSMADVVEGRMVQWVRDFCAFEQQAIMRENAFKEKLFMILSTEDKRVRNFLIPRLVESLPPPPPSLAPPRAVTEISTDSTPSSPSSPPQQPTLPLDSDPTPSVVAPASPAPPEQLVRASIDVTDDNHIKFGIEMLPDAVSKSDAPLPPEPKWRTHGDLSSNLSNFPAHRGMSRSLSKHVVPLSAQPPTE